MSDPEPRHRVLHAVHVFVASPRFASALSLTIVATAAGSFLLHRMIGWAGLIAILSSLVVIAVVALVLDRRAIEWHGLLPISLLAYVAWIVSSIFWSEYQWATFGGIAYLLAFTVLGFYLALARDTIQIVRAFGDVLRVALATSLVVEVVFGLLLDTSFDIIDVQGDLAFGGPIQGVFGSRNMLGMVALIALITFSTELRTRSVRREVGVWSLIGAAVVIVVARSPVAFGTLVILVIAAAALYGLRRARPEARTALQFVVLVLAAGLAGLAWLARGRLVDAFAASAELRYRLGVWREIVPFLQVNPLEGWGWLGKWRRNIAPYFAIGPVDGQRSQSAASAYVDVWLQAGVIGLALLLGLVGLAFVRSWLLAGRRRSVIYSWPALVLVVLLTVGLAESYLLVEFGWLTFVVCAVKASQSLSWRKALTPLPAAPFSSAPR